MIFSIVFFFPKRIIIKQRFSPAESNCITLVLDSVRNEEFIHFAALYCFLYIYFVKRFLVRYTHTHMFEIHRKFDIGRDEGTREKLQL